MNVSFAELKTLIRRAACGAGWSYAAAEELAAFRSVDGDAAAALKDIEAGEASFELGEAPPRPASRPEVGDADWATLMSLAAKTYVPATEASRAGGAGAGLRDND